MDYGIIVHFIHCIVFIIYLSISLYLTIHNSILTTEQVDKFKQYGYLYTSTIYFLQFIVILAIPQCLFNAIGVVIFNAFPKEPDYKSKGNPLYLTKLPHICFRTVTRGTFPDLVRNGVYANYATCVEAGLVNFTIEVVTDNVIPDLSNLDETSHFKGKVRQTVVPPNYQTKSGALFKARALQYALEPNVNFLGLCDYIVHLDEESLITTSLVIGVVNFIEDRKHCFGQGLITYTSQGIYNILTSIADGIRVAEDMGKFRTQFKLFHKPLYGWKGSFCVCKVQAEMDVSFDNGPDGSIAEDAYFALVAYSKGYSFDFIEGELYEKSPYTIMDFLKQRRRWMQGLWLLVHSSNISLRHKFFLGVSIYSWASLPLATLGVITSFFFPVPSNPTTAIFSSLCGSIVLYMYMFGHFKTFYNKKKKFPYIVLFPVLTLLVTPFCAIIENAAVIWGHLSPKHQFYIVDKKLSCELSPTIP